MVSVHEVAAADIAKRPSLNFPWRPDIMALAPDIKYAVDTYGEGLVTEAMLAAEIDRESNFANIFQRGVPKGPGCGVGPCQITASVDWSDPNQPTLDGLDLTVPRNNLVVAVRDFLVPALKQFPGSHQAAFDAYNLGSSGVAAEIAEGESPDTNTTDGNYGASVFQTWIGYAAILQGVTVDWSTWVPQ